MFTANLLDPAESDDGYVEPIANAFENYVVMQHAFRDCTGPRIDWIRRMLRGGCCVKRQVGIPIPVVRTEMQIVGAANLYLPDVEIPDSLGEWWPSFLLEAGESTRRFFELFFAATRSVELPPNVLLGMIGIRPEFQGMGAGRTLLEYIFELAANNPVAEGVALDTEVEANVSLYERFGFKVMGTGRVDDVPIWVMFRKND